MKLDVRTPIGAMFALDGALLTIYGLAVDQTEAIKKAGVNMTFTVGIVLFVFGAVMLGLAIQGRRAEKSAP
jgi:hypothetical protein